MGVGAAACDYVRVPFLIGRFKRLASPGPLLRTLMSVRISQINHCEFCVDFNAHNFLAANGAYEKIDFIDRWLEHPEVFSEEERAALAYPEAVTLNDDAGTACAMTELKRFFNDDAIVAITAWLGAPFVPKLHLVEKARMAMNGTLTARITLLQFASTLLASFQTQPGQAYANEGHRARFWHCEGIQILTERAFQPWSFTLNWPPCPPLQQPSAQ